MQQLENIIQNLESNKHYGVTITNLRTVRPIHINMTAAKMEMPPAQFFNDLVLNKGVKEFAVQPRKSNGSSWVDAGEVQKINVNPDSAPHPQTESPTLHHAVPMNNPLNGAFGGLHGMLNAPENFYRAMDYPKVEAENIVLKGKVETLEKQVADLKEAALENRFSDAKATGNKEMLSGIFEMLGPIATQLLAAKMGGGAVPDVMPGGLGSPADSLSEIKQQLINDISGSQDFICSYLLLIHNAMHTNPAFGDELLKLLETHKLISPAA